MWLKSDGMILAELLLSLSCLLMIGLFFTPMVIQLNNQRQNLQVEKQALQLLYEELQLLTIAPLTSQTHTTNIRGIEYQIVVQDKVPGQKEVCVKVEEKNIHFEKNICQLTE